MCPKLVFQNTLQNKNHPFSPLLKSLSENDLRVWLVTGKTAKISRIEAEQTHSQGSAMTRGESEINVSFPEPESIFKHLSIVSAREVTPSLSPFCDTDESKARDSQAVILYTDTG